MAKRMQAKERHEAIDDLVSIYSTVKLSGKEVTAIVEEEESKIHARQKADTRQQ